MFLRKTALLFVFLFFSPVFIILSIVSIRYQKSAFEPKTTSLLGEKISLLPNQLNQTVYASDYNFPVSSQTQAIITGDAVPIMIAKYLRHYQSPIPADLVVKYSKEFSVDPRLIIAIAQQESNLGKKMPEDCYNAWGFGIHSQGTLCFENWDNSIKTVIKGIADKYCQKGLCQDPCEMMKIYTPQSNGSWCFGINQFLAEMSSGDF